MENEVDETYSIVDFEFVSREPDLKISGILNYDVDEDVVFIGFSDGREGALIGWKTTRDMLAAGCYKEIKVSEIRMQPADPDYKFVLVELRDMYGNWEMFKVETQEITNFLDKTAKFVKPVTNQNIRVVLPRVK